MPLFKLSESIIGSIEDKDNTLHTDKTLQDFANDVELRDDKRDKEKILFAHADSVRFSADSENA